MRKISFQIVLLVATLPLGVFLYFKTICYGWSPLDSQQRSDKPPWRSNPQSTHVSHRDAGSDSRRKMARMSLTRHNADRVCSYNERDFIGTAIR